MDAVFIIGLLHNAPSSFGFINSSLLLFQRGKRSTIVFRACVRVRACVRACARACVCVCVCACVCVRVCEQSLWTRFCA